MTGVRSILVQVVSNVRFNVANNSGLSADVYVVYNNRLFKAEEGPSQTTDTQSVADTNTASFDFWLDRGSLGQGISNTATLYYDIGNGFELGGVYTMTFDVVEPGLVFEDPNDVLFDYLFPKPVGQINDNRFKMIVNPGWQTESDTVTIRTEGRGDVVIIGDNIQDIRMSNRVPESGDFDWAVINVDQNAEPGAHNFFGEFCVVDVNNEANALCHPVSGRTFMQQFISMQVEPAVFSTAGDNGMGTLSIRSTQSNDLFKQSGVLTLPSPFEIVGSKTAVEAQCTPMASTSSYAFDFKNEADDTIHLCVKFNPSQSGQYEATATVDVHHFFDNTVQYALSGAMTGVTNPEFVLATNTDGVVDFGQGAVSGDFSLQPQLTLRNYGNAAMPVQVTGEDDFVAIDVLGQSETVTVPAGQSVEYDLGLTVSKTGEHTGSVCLAVTGGAAQCVGATGVGQPRLVLSAENERLYRFTTDNTDASMNVALQWHQGSSTAARTGSVCISEPLRMANGQLCQAISGSTSSVGVTLPGDVPAGEHTAVLTAVFDQYSQSTATTSFDAKVIMPSVNAGQPIVETAYPSQLSDTFDMLLVNESGADLDLTVEGVPCQPDGSSDGRLTINQLNCGETLTLPAVSGSMSLNFTFDPRNTAVGQRFNYNVKFRHNGVLVASKAVTIDIVALTEANPVNFLQCNPDERNNCHPYEREVRLGTWENRTSLINYDVPHTVWLDAAGSDTRVELEVHPIEGDEDAWSFEITDFVVPVQGYYGLVSHFRPKTPGVHRAEIHMKSTRLSDNAVFETRIYETAGYAVTEPEYEMSYTCGPLLGVDPNDLVHYTEPSELPQTPAGTIVPRYESTHLPEVPFCMLFVRNLTANMDITGRVNIVTPDDIVQRVFCYNGNDQWCQTFGGPWQWAIPYFEMVPTKTEGHEVIIEVVTNTPDGPIIQRYPTKVFATVEPADLSIDECNNKSDCVLEYSKDADNFNARVSDTHTFTLTNTHSGSISTIKGSIDIDNGSFKLIDGEPEFELAAGQSRTFTLKFVGSGAQQGRVRIISNEQSGSQDKVILLKHGNGQKAMPVITDSNGVPIVAY